MQIVILLFLVVFMMPIKVRPDDVRHNVTTVPPYDMIVINFNNAFISLNYQLIPKAKTFRLEKNSYG